MLHTTLRLLRDADACEDLYTHLRKAANAAGYKGDKAPIPLSFILANNGLEDTLWALRAVVKDEESERDRVAGLCASDFSERVLFLFQQQCPRDLRPHEIIQAIRAFVAGEVPREVLETAGAAAWEVRWAAKTAGVHIGAPEEAKEAAAWAISAVVSAAEAVISPAWAVEGAAEDAIRAVEAAASNADSAETAGEAEREWQAQRLLQYLDK